MLRLLVVLAALSGFGLSPVPAQAQLVIAGGGLEAETQDVWQAFVDMAKADGDIVIVPSASGSPIQSANAASAVLERYGVDPDRIVIAQLALRDDESTPDIDEARWSRNGSDPDTTAQLSQAAAIWFTGGDQSRTTALLLPKGKASPALKAIRAAQHAGTPIGGTSAGAAIMSRVMLRQGDSLTALTGSDIGETLELGDGLGFLPRGIVDQHFGERARLGRLAAALMQQSEPADRIGFGIDENTALIAQVDGSASVAGTGYVTVLDARTAQARRIGDHLQISGLMVHLMSAGDEVDLQTLALTPADWKTATVGNEYVEAAQPGGGGMALRGQMLQDVIGEGLIDNAESDTVERFSFDGTGRGVGYVFTQSDRSVGFWGRGPDGRGRYAVANIRFDILPVALTLETLN